MHPRNIDITQLTQSRINIFSLAIRLLGLSAEDKDKLNLEMFYQQLFDKKLEHTIHQDLVNITDRRHVTAALKKQLAANLIAFAKSITTQEIYEILNHFVDLHAKKFNADGAMIFLSRIQNSESDLLHHNQELFDNQTFQIVIQTWKVALQSAKNKKTLKEKFRRCDEAACQLTIGGSVFILGTLTFIYIGFTHGLERALIFYLIVQMFCLHKFYVAVSAPPPPAPEAVSFEEDHVWAESKTQLDESLNATLEAYIKNYLENKKLQKENKQALLTPLPANPPVTFPDENAGVQRPRQLNRKVKPENAAVTVEEKTPQKIMGRNGNVFYLLFFANKKKAYYRFNKQQTIKLLEAPREDSKAVIRKIEGAIQTQRVNAPGEKKLGVTFVESGELEKFPGGLKLRTAADPQLSLALRIATEEEQALGIEEVVSPKGVQLHHR